MQVHDARENHGPKKSQNLEASEGKEEKYEPPWYHGITLARTRRPRATRRRHQHNRKRATDELKDRDIEKTDSYYNSVCI